ncbi:MAG: hypothetical protein ACI4V7_06285 [Succinivibrionaceae bacterium]
MKVKKLLLLMVMTGMSVFILTGCKDEKSEVNQEDTAKDAIRYVQEYHAKSNNVSSKGSFFIDGSFKVINIPTESMVTEPMFESRYISFTDNKKNMVSCGKLNYLYPENSIYQYKRKGVPAQYYDAPYVNNSEESKKEPGNLIKVPMTTINDSLYEGKNLCAVWDTSINDPNIVPIQDVNESKTNLTEKKVTQNIFVLNNYNKKNIKNQVFRYENSKNFINAQILLDNKKYSVGDSVSIYDMNTYDVATPAVLDDSGESFYAKAFYDNKILPIVSIGENRELLDSFIDDFNGNSQVSQWYDVTECRNYSINCVFTNNTPIKRSSHSIVVTRLFENYSIDPMGSTGINAWVGNIIDGIYKNSPTGQVTAIVSSMLAHNNFLTIEQIKYLLATNANYRKIIIPVKGKDYGMGWQKNGAGLWFSNEAGFGLVDEEKTISAVDKCSFDERCFKRSKSPNFDKYITSSNCKMVDRISPFTYKCRFIVPENIEIESVQLDISNLMFINTLKHEYCANMGKIGDLGSRFDEFGDYGYEVSDTLRRFVMTVNSSASKSGYIIKSKHENFFGVIRPIIKFDKKNKKSDFININSFYLENLRKGDFIDLNISTECQIDFVEGIVLRLVGYSQ